LAVSLPRVPCSFQQTSHPAHVRLVFLPSQAEASLRDFMAKTVVTAREADTSDRLMSEMTIRQFRHMPVVERGRLVGLVSIGDLCANADSCLRPSQP